MSRNIYKKSAPFQVGITMSRAVRNILEFRDGILKSHNLSSPEWFVLGYINAKTNQGGTRVGDVAAALDVQSTYVTGMLRKLEAKSLVDTRTDQYDRRARMVTATQKGADIANTVDAEFVKQGTAWFGNAPADSVQQYLEVLDIVARQSISE